MYMHFRQREGPKGTLEVRVGCTRGVPLWHNLGYPRHHHHPHPRPQGLEVRSQVQQEAEEDARDPSPQSRHRRLPRPDRRQDPYLNATVILTYVVILVLTLTNLNFSKLFQVGSLPQVSPLSSFQTPSKI